MRFIVSRLGACLLGYLFVEFYLRVFGGLDQLVGNCLPCGGATHVVAGGLRRTLRHIRFLQLYYNWPDGFSGIIGSN